MCALFKGKIITIIAHWLLNSLVILYDFASYPSVLKLMTK